MSFPVGTYLNITAQRLYHSFFLCAPCLVHTCFYCTKCCICKTPYCHMCVTLPWGQMSGFIFCVSPALRTELGTQYTSLNKYSIELNQWHSAWEVQLTIKQETTWDSIKLINEVTEVLIAFYWPSFNETDFYLAIDVAICVANGKQMFSDNLPLSPSKKSLRPKSSSSLLTPHYLSSLERQRGILERGLYEHFQEHLYVSPDLHLLCVTLGKSYHSLSF